MMQMLQQASLLSVNPTSSSPAYSSGPLSEQHSSSARPFGSIASRSNRLLLLATARLHAAVDAVEASASAHVGSSYHKVATSPCMIR